MKAIRKEIEELIDGFGPGSGYGDPEARRNDEIRLATLLSKEQSKTATRLNWLTFCLVIVGLLNVAVLAVQVIGQ